MKTIVAIIQPPKLQAILEALRRIGVERVVVGDGQGYGRQLGRTPTYRGHEYKLTLLRKIMLEITVEDDEFERTAAVLRTTGRTGPEGAIGDGKILNVPCLRAIDLADGSFG
ncbi:MAG: P-II family nitrogen regulator [Pirellulales bacterium]